MNEDGLLPPPPWRKIIVLNGPPGCGKDTAAQYMLSFIRRNATHMAPMHFKFSEPLKRAVHSLYCAFHNWDFYDSKDGAHQKNLASGDFMGLSPREAYIAMSEHYLKVMHGPEALGFLLRKRIIRHNASNVFVISDSGFVDELEPIVKLVGQRNLLVVEIHAANKTFEGDSRGYIGDEAKARWPHVEKRKLPNVFGSQQDKDFFKMLCEGTAKKFLDIEEDD